MQFYSKPGAMVPSSVEPNAPHSSAPLERLPQEILSQIAGDSNLTHLDVLAMRFVSRGLSRAVDGTIAPSLQLPRMHTDKKPARLNSVGEYLQVARTASAATTARAYHFAHYGVGRNAQLFTIDASTCLVLCENHRILQGSLEPSSHLFEEVLRAGILPEVTFRQSWKIVDAVRSFQPGETYRLLIQYRFRQEDSTIFFVACMKDGTGIVRALELANRLNFWRSASFDQKGLFVAAKQQSHASRYFCGFEQQNLVDQPLEKLAPVESPLLAQSYDGDDVYSASTGACVRGQNDTGEPKRFFESTKIKCLLPHASGVEQAWSVQLQNRVEGVTFSPDGARLGVESYPSRYDRQYSTLTFSRSPYHCSDAMAARYDSIRHTLLDGLDGLSIDCDDPGWAWTQGSGWLYMADRRPSYWGFGLLNQHLLKYHGIQARQRWVGLRLDRSYLEYRTVLNAEKQTSRANRVWQNAGASLSSIFLTVWHTHPLQVLAHLTWQGLVSVIILSRSSQNLQDKITANSARPVSSELEWLPLAVTAWWGALLVCYIAAPESVASSHRRHGRKFLRDRTDLGLAPFSPVGSTGDSATSGLRNFWPETQLFRKNKSAACLAKYWTRL